MIVSHAAKAATGSKAAFEDEEEVEELTGDDVSMMASLDGVLLSDCPVSLLVLSPSLLDTSMIELLCGSSVVLLETVEERSIFAAEDEEFAVSDEMG